MILDQNCEEVVAFNKRYIPHMFILQSISFPYMSFNKKKIHVLLFDAVVMKLLSSQLKRPQLMCAVTTLL